MVVKKKSAVETDAVDQLADDAEELEEYPEGAPALVPFLSLRPRSKRAQFKRKFGEFETVKDRMDELRKSGALDPEKEHSFQEQISASADLDDMYQYMDELLELAAADPPAYRAWSDQLDDDNDLTRVFNVYMRSTQPGEASSSAS